MPFEFQSLPLAGLKLIVPRVFHDERGAFMETFKESDFAAAGIPGPFVQDNLSTSRKGVIRGLHFQKEPHAQAKLVQVLSGAIFDVVVDLRPGSPDYGKWLGVPLDETRPAILYVPAGFAHGFQAVSEKAVVLYKSSSPYHPDSEAGVAWDDPDLAVAWPLAAPLLSGKDKAQPSWRAFQFSQR
jgi:dTDP-4-dehydrorhamnose 3,5-epimerase